MSPDTCRVGHVPCRTRAVPDSALEGGGSGVVAAAAVAAAQQQQRLQLRCGATRAGAWWPAAFLGAAGGWVFWGGAARFRSQGARGGAAGCCTGRRPHGRLPGVRGAV